MCLFVLVCKLVGFIGLRVMGVDGVGFSRSILVCKLTSTDGG